MTNEILFIGTGSGKTSLKRFHSSLLITINDFRILFDAGDSVSRALLSQEIDFNSIDAIIISHFHADHYAGLISLLTQMHLSKRGRNLTIIAHTEFLEQTKNFINQSYLFEEVFTFNLNFSPFNFNEQFNFTEEFYFTAKQNSHIRNKHELANYPHIKFISSSFLFSINNKNIFITSDIGAERDLYLFDLNQIDILIAEITHVNKESYQQILTKFPNIKIYLTHIDDSDMYSFKIWESSLIGNHQSRLKIAQDGTKLTL